VINEEKDKRREQDQQRGNGSLARAEQKAGKQRKSVVPDKSGILYPPGKQEPDKEKADKGYTKLAGQVVIPRLTKNIQVEGQYSRNAHIKQAEKEVTFKKGNNSENGEENDAYEANDIKHDDPAIMVIASLLPAVSQQIVLYKPIEVILKPF
jgi:hypothetical protein